LTSSDDLFPAFFLSFLLAGAAAAYIAAAGASAFVSSLAFSSGFSFLLACSFFLSKYALDLSFFFYFEAVA